jgi:hypothetical protein
MLPTTPLLLATLGWLSDAKVPRSVVHEALLAYGESVGITEADGSPLERMRQAERMLALPRCGHPDVREAKATACRWPIQDLRVGLFYRDFGGFTAVDWSTFAGLTMAKFEAVCGVRFEVVPTVEPCHIALGSRVIDGHGYTLGLAQLPCAGTTAKTQLGNWLDERDNWRLWGESMALSTLAHEMAHNLGLEHDEPGTLMAAIVNQTITEPQPKDVAQLLARYPQRAKPRPRPTPVPKPDPEPEPGPSSQPTRITLEQAVLTGKDGAGQVVTVQIN